MGIFDFLRSGQARLF